MAVVLPVKGSLNWDISLNAALTYLDNNTTTLAGNAVIQGVTVAGGNLSGTFPDPLVVSTSLSSPLPVNQGGTGSATQPYVDLTSNQTIAGNKTFTGQAAFTQTSGTNVAVTGTATGQRLVGVTGADTTSLSLASMVSGDTFDRYRLGVDGTTSWGPGTATRDTTVGRATTGTAYVNSNLLVGTATDLGDNGSGEIKLANATTAPTTNPTGGALMYATAGNIKSRNSQGLVLSDAGVASTNISTTTISTGGLQALQSFTVPANDPAANAVYEIAGYGVYTSNATATSLIVGVYWGGISGVLLAGIPAFTIPASVTNGSFYYKAIVTFRTSTTCTSHILLNFGNGSNVVTSYIINSNGASTVTTSSAEALTIGVTLNNAQTISLMGGDIRRMA